MMNMRSYRGPHCRTVSISHDGGQTWGDIRDDAALVKPMCQASLTRQTHDGKTRLLFSNPADPTQRANLTIRMSDDDGKTWPRSVVLYLGPSLHLPLIMTPRTAADFLRRHASVEKTTLISTVRQNFAQLS